MTDPFERGFESAQRRRLDLPPEPTQDERKRWQRPGRLGWQVIVVALGVVVLIAVGRSVTARNATGLKPDCKRFQLAVGEKTVVSHGPALLHWAATAPAGTRFYVAIAQVDGSVNGFEQRTREQTMSGDCIARGQFGVLVRPGHYLVELLQNVNPGNAVKRLAFHAVTVTAS